MRYQKNIRKTMKYAKKGLSLWLRASIHAFVMIHKGMFCLNLRTLHQVLNLMEHKRTKLEA
jgi:hypothetical protein